MLCIVVGAHWSAHDDDRVDGDRDIGDRLAFIELDTRDRHALGAQDILEDARWLAGNVLQYEHAWPLGCTAHAMRR